MRKTLALNLVLAAALGAFSPLRAQGTPPTWVILVRHAEKATAPADDPPLNAAGLARAKLLADRLAFTKLDAILTTQFTRTATTAAATAKQHGVTPEVVPTTTANHVQAVADRIRALQGKVTLVVGHSNTVPDIVAALGAPKPKAICDSEYDNLYIVTIPATGSATVVQTRFGAPAPADAACASMR